MKLTKKMLKATESLIKKYRSITPEQIEKNYWNATFLTGFNQTSVCKLCIATDNRYVPNCDKCIWAFYSEHIGNKSFHYHCLGSNGKRSNKKKCEIEKTFDAIKRADYNNNTSKLKAAFEARADLLEKALNLYLGQQLVVK